MCPCLLTLGRKRGADNRVGRSHAVIPRDRRSRCQPGRAGLTGRWCSAVSLQRASSGLTAPLLVAHALTIDPLCGSEPLKAMRTGTARSISSLSIA